jgi:hypothetical protein
VAGKEVFATLHRWMHALPGMPSHVTRGSGFGRHPVHAPHALRVHAPHALRVHPHHAVRQARVLRAWQAWIGALFGVRLP